ncbi:cytochrome-c peroxidase [Agrobacterium vitis]|uniref:cytochrome-c peroxidase n=1 Tax=Agrobacterium vitis TaxID=373 RepID=UPI002035AC8D|nr:cytochrome-c peroxidase [Agrobacterium vitis]
MALFDEKSRLPLLALALLSLAFAGLGRAAQTLAEKPTQAQTGAPGQLSAGAQLGKALFFDQSLSGSGKMSCATCHDPAHHYAPANTQAVQMGGRDLNLPGIRPVPSLA